MSTIGGRQAALKAWETRRRRDYMKRLAEAPLSRHMATDPCPTCGRARGRRISPATGSRMIRLEE
jgi:hypothetical protein